MCKAPKAPAPVTPPPPISPAVVDDAAITERDREKRRRAGMRGRQSTMLTESVQFPQTGAAKTAFGA